MKVQSLKSAALAVVVMAGLLTAHAQTATPAAPTTSPAPTSPVAPAPVAATCKVAAVNVNTGLQADLSKIPGIDAKLAAAIIAARPLKNEADLVKRVKGIGKKNILKFRPCFTY